VIGRRGTAEGDVLRVISQSVVENTELRRRIKQ